MKKAAVSRVGSWELTRVGVEVEVTLLFTVLLSVFEYSFTKYMNYSFIFIVKYCRGRGRRT